ncbi:MAG TPA: aminotransferase class I/II-fold pyridoxal phosphate-dependent enzyme [Streptosporangiaceae bacterium]|jgi:histidinol-phosphate aminotransferase|nr:aminotransferase class I/II-fold pyridoxal phosphate-dependent enzyme [Streptosporangiaceae bacterium]
MSQISALLGSLPAGDEFIRLHMSESAFGVSPAALAAARHALDGISLYPDPARRSLITDIATAYGVAEEQVAVANGSDELILLSSLAVGDLSRPGLVTAGTFPGYRACLERTRRGSISVPLDGTAIDVTACIDALPRAGIAFLCNPHNPAGGALRRDELDSLVCTAAGSGVPLIIDEAYMEFAPAGTPQVADYLAAGGPLLCLRTFSKAYGLAALRIGYAVGSAKLVSALRSAQECVPFSANRVALAAAAAALGDGDTIANVRTAGARRRDWFTAELTRRGLRYLPSVTNFVAVAVADSAIAERRLAQEHGILVRDAGRFGFPGFLRISLGEREELLRCLDALQETALTPSRGR